MPRQETGNIQREGDQREVSVPEIRGERDVSLLEKGEITKRGEKK